MNRIHRIAQNLALNNGERYHVVCILYRQRRPIYIGVNTHKTHPKFKRIAKDGSCVGALHAEMSALRFAKKGDTLEVLRFLKCGKITMAKPCIHCSAFLAKSSIKKVRYTTWDGCWECAKPCDL